MGNANTVGRVVTMDVTRSIQAGFAEAQKKVEEECAAEDQASQGKLDDLRAKEQAAFDKWMKALDANTEAGHALSAAIHEANSAILATDFAQDAVGLVGSFIPGGGLVRGGLAVVLGLTNDLARPDGLSALDVSNNSRAVLELSGGSAVGSGVAAASRGAGIASGVASAVTSNPNLFGYSFDVRQLSTALESYDPAYLQRTFGVDAGALRQSARAAVAAEDALLQADAEYQAAKKELAEAQKQASEGSRQCVVTRSQAARDLVLRKHGIDP